MVKNEKEEGSTKRSFKLHRL